jgi:hypothetical protein
MLKKLKKEFVNKKDIVLDELHRLNHIVKNPNGIKDKINYYFFNDRNIFHDFKSRHLFPKDLNNSEIRRAQKDIVMRENIK